MRNEQVNQRPNIRDCNQSTRIVPLWHVQRTFLENLAVNANMLLGGPDFIGTKKRYEKLARKVADYVKRTKRFDYIIIVFHINVYACFKYRIKDSVATLRKHSVLLRSCVVRVSFDISLVSPLFSPSSKTCVEARQSTADYRTPNTKVLFD